MDFSQEYINFQSKSFSPFHVTHTLASELEKSGFIELSMDSSWCLSEKKLLHKT